MTIAPTSGTFTLLAGEASVEGSVSVSVSNPSEVPLYVWGACGVVAFALEQKVGSDWEPRLPSQSCLAGLQAEVVGPRASRVFSLPVNANVVLESGVYRVDLELLSRLATPDEVLSSNRWPKESRLSDEFQLIVIEGP